jgi:hypothetical protein
MSHSSTSHIAHATTLGIGMASATAATVAPAEGASATTTRSHRSSSTAPMSTVTPTLTAPTTTTASNPTGGRRRGRPPAARITDLGGHQPRRGRPPRQTVESNRDWHDNNLCDLRSTPEGGQEEHEDEHEQNVRLPLILGDAEINFGGEAATSTEARHPPPAAIHPTFSFPVRIPAFVLDDYLHILANPS